MPEDNPSADEQVLNDAALVRAYRRRVDPVIADLAARPLDERVVDQMRRVLDDHRTAAARKADRRLQQLEDSPGPRRLRVIDGEGGGGAA